MSWQTGYPPQSGYYLVTIQEFNGHRLASIFLFNATTGWIGIEDKVLAWQPLPEPYQPPAPQTKVGAALERLAAKKKPEAPWPTLADGFTPPGIQFYDRVRGPMLLANDPGSAWDGWLLVRNPEDNGWVSLRQASDWERGQFERHGQVQEGPAG